MNYFEIDAANFSTIKHLEDSPLHYQDALENERKDTPSLLRGRAVHTAVLEPHEFDTRYAVFPGERRQGKAWEEFQAAHPDEDGILKAKERDQVLALAKAFRKKPIRLPNGGELELAELLERGKSEETITWKDPVTGVLCKARVDHFGLVLLELKTTTSVHERRFGALAARMKYHVQAAFYSDGLLYARGLNPPVKIIAGEIKSPYDVAVFSLSEDDLLAGRETYQGWLKRLVECRASNVWPGRYPDEQPLSLPVYVFEDDQEDGTAVVLTGEAA